MYSRICNSLQPCRFHNNATVDRSSLTANSASSQSGRSATTEYLTPSNVTVTSSNRAYSQPLSLRIKARTYPSAPVPGLYSFVSSPLSPYRRRRGWWSSRMIPSDVVDPGSEGSKAISVCPNNMIISW